MINVTDTAIPKQASLLHGLTPGFPRDTLPEKDKALVLSFMRGVRPRWHTGACVVDPVSGKTTDIDLNASESGGWGWDSSETYLFEKYDLALKPEFVEFALAEFRK